jgi:hypothetical protein
MAEERGLRESQLQRAKVEEGPGSFQAGLLCARIAGRQAALLLGAYCFGIVSVTWSLFLTSVLMSSF